MSQQRLIGPWRAALQWGLFILWLALPFVRPGGIGLLRIDLATLSLELGGRRLPIEELYLLLLLSLALLLLLLFLTLALGRVWCGWGCPQTALVDFAEGLATSIGLRVNSGRIHGTRLLKMLLQCLYLLLAFVLAYSFIAYFSPPAELYRDILTGRLSWPVLLTIGILAAAIYLDLALLRRLFCREFCPYGRFQAALIDPGTLTLRFHPADAPRCIRCGACTRVCPVGIDIRQGEQIECINCGRCLDACRSVMHTRDQNGIIRYTFALDNRGVKALLNPRLLLVGTALASACAIFLIAVLNRPDAVLKFGRSAASERPLDNGRSAIFYQATVQNRTARPQQMQLVGQLQKSGTALTLLGPIETMQLEPGERRKLDFAIVLSADTPRSIAFELRLLDHDHTILARATGLLPERDAGRVPAGTTSPEK